MIKGVKSGAQKERAWIPEKSTAHFPPSSCPNSEPGKCEFHLECSCLFSFLTPHIFPESPVTLIFGKIFLLVSNTPLPAAAPISRARFQSLSVASGSPSSLAVSLPLSVRALTPLPPRPPSIPRLWSSRMSPVSLSLSPEGL